MPLIDSCCCWDTSLKTGSRGAAVFTMVTAFINIVIGIWSLVQLHFLDNHLFDHEKENFLPPGIIPLTYILFAISFVTGGLGLVLLVGINRGYEGKKFIWAWILCIFSFRVFDIFIGTYVVTWLGGHRIDDIIFVTPELIVVVAYWIINTFIMVAALICVISYWQELGDVVNRKGERVKQIQRLANSREDQIRRAGGRTPGWRTPRNMSRLTLNQSRDQSSTSQVKLPLPLD